MRTAALLAIGFLMVVSVPLQDAWIGLIPLAWGGYRLYDNKGFGIKGVNTSDKNAIRCMSLVAYPEQGVFTCKGRKFDLEDVRNVDFQQTSSGFFGGGTARYDITTNDMKKPLITIRSFALTKGGLLRKFQRLCIALNCDQRVR